MDSKMMGKLIALGHLQAENASLRQQLENAHTRISELVEQGYSRFADDTIAKHERQEAQKRAEKLQATLDEVMAANKRLQEQVNRLAGMNEAMRLTISEKNGQITEMSQRIDRLHAELHSTHGQASLIEDANAQLVGRVNALREENTRLKEDMREAAKPVRVPVTAVGGVGQGAPTNGDSSGSSAEG